MSRYKPGLDDDRLVAAALEALAHDTDEMEAPPAVESRLRAAFRAAPGSAPAPEVPKRSGAWKWVVTVGVAAGLVWVAYATTRTGPAAAPPRDVARGSAPAPTIAPRESASPVARVPPRVVSTEAPRAVRAATAEPSRARRRPAPRVERFEPLYPGDPLEDLDAVHLVRVSVPRSALATLGWPSRPGARDDRVQLDAMVGPDGMARAVRFISQ